MDTKRFIEEKIREIRAEVGDGRAIVATSGGVDSATCAILVHKALGKRLTAVFIDDGLMRESEPEAVMASLRKLGLTVRLVEAKNRFFEALKGLEDPEEKRRAFRETFYRVLGKVVQDEEATHLIQGTIAADVAETKGGIKTQHNVLAQIGIDPSEYGFSVIEPLKDLYKPEVREVAQVLDLPKELFERMPFPGPGLALRVIGEVAPVRVEIVRAATQIVEEEILPLRIDPTHPFQALAVLLKDRSTGVVKGKRAFGDIIVVRVVDSEDAMTATPTDVPREIRNRIVGGITREIPSVVRVLFDETPKPPSTIEYI